MNRVFGRLALSVLTFGAGCSEIDKLTESDRGSNASRIALSAQSPIVPLNGATNIDVRVTKSDGSAVKDGTKITMTASLGRIEPSDIRTQDGGATVAYRAGGTAGSAKLTAVSGSAQAELILSVQGPAPPPEPPKPAPPTRASFDLRQVEWLDPDVSGWPETSRVTSASIEDPPICIHHTKAGQWPVKDEAEGNPWIFVNLNGKWYGATFEWLSPGQECKYVTRDNIGANIGRSPLSSWRPRSGEVVGLMVSARARFRADTVQERSNVVMVRWP